MPTNPAWVPNQIRAREFEGLVVSRRSNGFMLQSSVPRWMLMSVNESYRILMAWNFIPILYGITWTCPLQCSTVLPREYDVCFLWIMSNARWTMGLVNHDSAILNRRLNCSHTYSLLSWFGCENWEWINSSALIPREANLALDTS